jgi:addiction module RelE/StbE family toxin
MRPVFDIVWRPRARADLIAVIRYIAQDSPLHAEAFGAMIRQQTDRLSAHPHSGRPGRYGAYRELVVHRNYLVLYRIIEETGIVEILAVKHARRRHP